MTIAEPWQIRLAQALSMGIGLDKQWNVKRIRNVSNKEMWNSEIRISPKENEPIQSMNTALVERHLFQRNKMRHDIDSEGILAQVTSSDPNSLCQALLCGSSMATEHTAAKSCTVCLHFQRRPSCESLWYPIRRNRPKNHFWTPNPSGSLEIFNLWNCSRHMVWIWGESSVPALKPFAWNFTSATLGSTICPGTARNLYAQIVLSINFRTPKLKMWTSYILNAATHLATRCTSHWWSWRPFRSNQNLSTQRRN